VTEFFFLQGKRYKTIPGGLSGVLEEAAVSIATVRHWCRGFKDGTFSLDDEFGVARPRNDIGEAISQFLSRDPFLSSRVLEKRLATSPYTIKEILRHDLGMRKFRRRWVPHDRTARDKAKRVFDALMLLQPLRNDQSQNFSHSVTGDESWFYYNYDSPTMFAYARDKLVPGVSPTIGLKKVMITIFSLSTDC
jgi:hypothetical protein